jgi:hypothetical protein
VEADWSVELGEGLAEIVVPWSAEGLAWVDLRAPQADSAAAVQDITLKEAQPALAAALEVLNEERSPWLTSKCDAWLIDCREESLDPYELDAADLAAQGAPLYGCGSYLDVLARDAGLFPSFEAHEMRLRTLTKTLRAQPLPHARVDLVLRAARLYAQEGFAITAYVTGCGPDAAAALQAWQCALAAMTQTLLNR